ncbi:MAG: hypothetical protein KGQ60_03055 [Planctomycetes bacterium]|nr:hypothetical protein [Planctomycetota bacterium]
MLRFDTFEISMSSPQTSSRVDEWHPQSFNHWMITQPEPFPFRQIATAAANKAF